MYVLLYVYLQYLNELVPGGCFFFNYCEYVAFAARHAGLFYSKFSIQQTEQIFSYSYDIMSYHRATSVTGRLLYEYSYRVLQSKMYVAYRAVQFGVHITVYCCVTHGSLRVQRTGFTEVYDVLHTDVQPVVHDV